MEVEENGYKLLSTFLSSFRMAILNIILKLFSSAMKNFG
jgi:hypothetical protein